MKTCEDCGKVIVKSTARWCKKHGYQHRVRPRGLKYNITKDNPTSFKKGSVPWNAGLMMKEKITYKELHKWVRRVKGNPGECITCGATPTQWANKSHEYMRTIDDWIALCKKCHGAYDSGDNRGAAVAIFGRKGVACR